MEIKTQFTDSERKEICNHYKNIKHDGQELTILAELNTTSTEVIKSILIEEGYYEAGIEPKESDGLTSDGLSELKAGRQKRWSDEEVIDAYENNGRDVAKAAESIGMSLVNFRVRLRKLRDNDKANTVGKLGQGITTAQEFKRQVDEREASRKMTDEEEKQRIYDEAERKHKDKLNKQTEKTKKQVDRISIIFSLIEADDTQEIKDSAIALVKAIASKEIMRHRIE